MRCKSYSRERKDNKSRYYKNNVRLNFLAGKRASNISSNSAALRPLTSGKQKNVKTRQTTMRPANMR